MSDAVMVPREPTEAMLNASIEGSDVTNGDDFRRAVWTAMVGAARHHRCDTATLRTTCQRMSEDYQTSAAHHPEHVLVRKTDFDAVVCALAREPHGGANEADVLATLLDNVVIAQGLSRDLRERAHDAARSYLYDRRQALAASTPVGGWEEPVAWLRDYHLGHDDNPCLGLAQPDDANAFPVYAAPPPASVSTDKGSRPQEAVPSEQAEAAVLVLKRMLGEVESFHRAPDNARIWIGGWSTYSGQRDPSLVHVGEVRAAIGDADGCSSNEGASAAHTPGPWVARRMHTGGFDIFDPRNRDVVTVYGGGVETESREANARLIAAAPCMALTLAEIACKADLAAAACDDEGRASGFRIIAADARTAIAKATILPQTEEGS